MTHTRIQPTSVTCNTLIHGLCRIGQLGRALQLKNDMVKWNCRPDVVSYSAIIDTLCKGGLVDQALVLFSEMHRDSNAVPINILIDAHCKDEGKRVFEGMVSRGISADITTYTTLIHGHCLHGQWEEARRYFDEMMDRGILLNIVTFSILIDAHCKDGMTRRCLGII
ncbi:pentatricopeptide repeat-containing protein At1g62910-like [Papaver somniferum]|uniref:pentatricopeptide repeat-containing protein At1g62910-like n=1 Tax=Papaver somniferum TaxID=3469 RepID=UPI000E6FF741|nr:pentatricopeptide repeat-containing protein At1g62910-like [Papaver somniferum]